MAKIHINPETGKPARCTAKKKCKYSVNGEEPQHYSSFEEATKAYEKEMDDKKIETISKKQEKPLDKYSDKYLKQQEYDNETDPLKKYQMIKHSTVLSDVPTSKLSSKIEEKLNEHKFSRDYGGDIRYATVTNKNGLNDVYVMDDDGIYIAGATDLNENDAIKFAERANVRHILFNNNRYDKVDNMSVRPMNSINKEYSDNDIDNIINKAKETNVEPLALGAAGRIIAAENPNSDAENIPQVKDVNNYGNSTINNILNVRMNNRDYYSDEDIKQTKEFLTYVRNYKK